MFRIIVENWDIFMNGGLRSSNRRARPGNHFQTEGAQGERHCTLQDLGKKVGKTMPCLPTMTGKFISPIYL